MFAGTLMRVVRRTSGLIVPSGSGLSTVACDPAA